LVGALLALLAIVGIACGASATAVPAQPAAKAAPVAAPAAPVAAPVVPKEVFKIKFTSPLAPPPFIFSEVQKWWADQVQARSGGRIVFTDFYWLGALTRAGEELEAIEVGLAQAGSIQYPYYVGKLPLGNWNYPVPFGPGPKEVLAASQRIFDEVPALRAEIGKYNQNIIMFHVIDTYNLTSKKPIVNLDDFKGLKIASIGAYHPKILKDVGATAIAMPVGERYEALSSGIIEAEFLPWDISYAYKFHEINKHVTWVDMGSNMPVVTTVNRDFWNRLPADLQDLMLQVGKEAMAQNIDIITKKRTEALAAWAAAGVTRHDMPEAERAKWAAALPDYPKLWVDDMEAKGLPGKRIMTKYLDLLEEQGWKPVKPWAAEYRPPKK
jgi:TRAP-type C4-dicarboxylate transport system substrate-binding protein